MTAESYDERFQHAQVADDWSPSERARTWLAMGVAALALDLVLGIAVTVLELKHWGQDGLTPDVVLGYVAIVPQACVFVAFLVLARDIGARGLWKSTAGLFASYLLASLVGMAMLDGIPRGWVVAANVSAAIGIVGLLWFSLSSWPRWQQHGESTPLTAAGESDQNDEVAASPVATVEPESEGGGWAVHIAVALGLVALKFIVRGLNRGLPNLDLGLGGWTFLELAIVAAFGLGFLVWFAIAKIRLRHQLGGLAAVLGGWELLILLLHVGMLVAIIWVVAVAVAANPLLDDDAMDALVDSWLQHGTVVSAVCHAIWVLLAGALFASLWMRPQADWRAGFGPSRGSF